jgi:hypothetical protein
VVDKDYQGIILVGCIKSNLKTRQSNRTENELGIESSVKRDTRPDIRPNEDLKAESRFVVFFPG